MVDNVHKALGYLLFIIGLSLIIKNNQDLDFFSLILINLIFASSLFFVYLPILNPKFIYKIPLLTLINLFFLICYLGVFFLDKNKIFFFLDENGVAVNRYSVNEYSDSILVLFIGYLFFHIGYFILNFLSKNFKRKKFDYLTSNIDEIFVIGFFLLFSVIIFFYILKIQNILNFLSQLKYPLLLFGIGLCFHYLIKKKNIKKINFTSLLLLIFIPIFIEIMSGSFNFPFMIIFLLYIYYIVINKKINLIPFILISIIFLFTHLGKYDFRLKTWSDTQKNLNFFERSKIFFNVYFQNQGNDLKIENLIKRSDNFRLERRIFHSYWSLIIVTKNTPAEVPFWDGYSYKILSSKLIPRIFWKNKPSDILGNQFGHRYNILVKESENTIRDNSTSWNMPVLNEFYVNFGKSGVAIGMFLIGLIINSITRVFGSLKDDNLESIIAFYLFVPLFFLESHLSLLFGALIQSYVFLIILSFTMLFLLRRIKW